MNMKTNYGTIAKEVIKNYKAWLDYSNISEQDLLKFRFLRHIDLRVQYLDGVSCVSLIIGNDNNFRTIGEPFVSPESNLNEQFYIDVSFLLLYIAERLDEANRCNPPLGFSDTDNEYFYLTIMNQIKEKLIE